MPPPFTLEEWNQGWKHGKDGNQARADKKFSFRTRRKGGCGTPSDIFTRARAANEKRTKISNSIFSPSLVPLPLSLRAQVELPSFSVSSLSERESLMRLAGNTRTWLKFVLFVSKAHYHKKIPLSKIRISAAIGINIPLCYSAKAAHNYASVFSYVKMSREII